MKELEINTHTHICIYKYIYITGREDGIEVPHNQEVKNMATAGQSPLLSLSSVLSNLRCHHH